MTQYELNLRDYWRVLKKRKNIVILTTIMVIASSIFFSLKDKPILIYQSTTSVKIIDNQNIEGLYMEMNDLEASDSIETQIMLIKSFPIMEKVAKEIDFLDKNLSSNEIRINKKYLEIVLDLKDTVSAVKEGDTSIINITSTSEDPTVVQKIANATAKVYRDEVINEKNNRIIKAKEFIENQLKTIGEKLKSSEENMQSFMEETQIVSIESHINRNFNKLAEAEDNFDAISKKALEIKIIINHIEKENNLPSRSFKNLSIEDFTTNFITLSKNLTELNIKKDLLEFDLTARHPEIEQVVLEISDTRKKIIYELKTFDKSLQRKLNLLKIDIKKLKNIYLSMPRSELTLVRMRRNIKINEDIYTQLETKYQEVLIKEAEKFEGVTIVRPALEPDDPINEKKITSNIFIGAFLGIILGLVFAFIFETMDTSITSITEVENLLNVSVIGIIPRVKNEEIKSTLKKVQNPNVPLEVINKNAHLVFHFPPMSPFTESYKGLRTNIQFIQSNKGIKVILFTSTSQSEGKTISSINTAISLAQSGKKVLLIDGDIRKPEIHQSLGLNRGPGLSDVILGNCEWKDAVNDAMDIILGNLEMESIMFVPGIDNLFILTSGDATINPTELLISDNMTKFINEIKNNYDFVIFDCSPTLSSSDSSILGSKVDGVFIVYKTGEIARGALTRSKTQLESIGAKVCGIILNWTSSDISPDLYTNHYRLSKVSYQNQILNIKKKLFKKWTFSYFIKCFKKSDGVTKKNWTSYGYMGRIILLLLSITFLWIGFLYGY